jgi:hypothetical protein
MIIYFDLKINFFKKNILNIYFLIIGSLNHSCRVALINVSEILINIYSLIILNSVDISIFTIIIYNYIL